MKRNTQLYKIISVLMIFVLLISTSGCSTSKTLISSSEIPVGRRYYYIIHSQNEKSLLENPIIENEIISGKISYNKSVNGNKIHIYLKSETVINVTADKMVTVSFDDIDKVEIAKVSTGRTILFVIGSAIGLLLLIALIGGPVSFVRL